MSDPNIPAKAEIGGLRAGTTYDYTVTGARDPRFGTTTGLINETQLFRDGIQAFEEFNPIRSEVNAGGVAKFYRYRTFGSDAAMFLLDARTFRDQELVPANLLDPFDIDRFLVQSFRFPRTLLGSEQLATLKGDLLDAQMNGITWKCSCRSRFRTSALWLRKTGMKDMPANGRSCSTW